MVIGALKSCDIFLGIQIEIHMHMSPKLSPLADLEALGKEEVKAKAGLTPACWSIEGEPQSSYRGGPWQRWRLTGLRYLRKSLSNHYLTTKLMQQKLQQLHVTKNTNFKKLVQESHQANSSNSNKSQGGMRISFPELTWYLKCPALPKDYETCKEIGKNDSYTKGKKALNRNCS